MNADLSYFSADVQTTAEIEELSQERHVLWQRLSDQQCARPKASGGCPGIGNEFINRRIRAITAN